MKYIFILFFIFNTIHTSDNNRFVPARFMDPNLLSDFANFPLLRIRLMQNDPVIKHETSIHQEIRNRIASSNSDTTKEDLKNEDARFLRVIDAQLETYEEYRKAKKHLEDGYEHELTLQRQRNQG